MVDLNEENENATVNMFVGKTQQIKTKMMSFLGSSSDLITGISNRLESALTLSETSYSTADTSTRQLTTPSSHTGSEYGAALPSVSRKLNSLPSFGLSFEDYEAMLRHKEKQKKTNTKSSTKCEVIGEESETNELSDDKEIPEKLFVKKKSANILDGKNTKGLISHGPDPYDKIKVKEVTSSESASDADGYGPSTSIDSSGRKYWIRSGSEGSLQSWASSLSLDSYSDEIIVEFMRMFVGKLFQNSSSITVEEKAQFGQLCQNETGRLWFSRFVNVQRAKSKCVNEETFYALIQYFATVLFECGEYDDFSPAKSLMNMCFTFYLEVDVPGCLPYKEYLFTYLRHQPIWHTLRFWNAAFFDALQCERVHRPIITKDEIKFNHLEAFADDKQYQENITFGQLGTFTYNMHAFGLSRDLCLEFLRKQCTIANLSKEQETLLRDNVEKMYKETDMWRQK